MTIKKFLGVTVLMMASIGLMVGCSDDAKKVANNLSNTTESVKKDMSWENVKNRGELVVGSCAAYPPFESRNEKTGEIEGFDVDIAKAMGEELGVEVKFKDTEWSGLLGGITKGDFDIIISCMNKQEASAENVNMSNKYYDFSTSAVVLKGNSEISDLEDLKGKVVGVQMGSGSEQIADDMGGFKEIKRYNYNPEAFIDLRSQRIDSVIVGYPYAANEYKKNKDIKILDKEIATADVIMVMKQGADELTQKINEALKKVEESGKSQEALDKWLKIDIDN